MKRYGWALIGQVIVQVGELGAWNMRFLERSAAGDDLIGDLWVGNQEHCAIEHTEVRIAQVHLQPVRLHDVLRINKFLGGRHDELPSLLFGPSS